MYYVVPIVVIKRTWHSGLSPPSSLAFLYGLINNFKESKQNTHKIVDALYRLYPLCGHMDALYRMYPLCSHMDALYRLYPLCDLLIGCTVQVVLTVQPYGCTVQAVPTVRPYGHTL